MNWHKRKSITSVNLRLTFSKSSSLNKRLMTLMPSWKGLSRGTKIALRLIVKNCSAKSKKSPKGCKQKRKMLTRSSMPSANSARSLRADFRRRWQMLNGRRQCLLRSSKISKINMKISPKTLSSRFKDWKNKISICLISWLWTSKEWPRSWIATGKSAKRWNVNCKTVLTTTTKTKRFGKAGSNSWSSNATSRNVTSKKPHWSSSRLWTSCRKCSQRASRKLS